MMKNSPLILVVWTVCLATACADVAVTTTGLGNTGPNLPFSLGYRFTVSQPIQVTDVGRYDVNGGGLTVDALARLYDWNTGTTLASTMIATSSSGESDGTRNVHYAPLASPVTLSPGTSYLVAVEVTGGDFAYNVPGTLASPISYQEGRATPVGSPAMPATATTGTFSIARTDGNLGTYLGPNFKFTTTASDWVTVNSLSPRQILQRDDSNRADVPVEGAYGGSVTRVEARAVPVAGFGGSATDWAVIDSAPSGGAYAGTLDVPTGWYSIEVRTFDGATEQAGISVDRLGIGDVFITAGQSNSANYGSPRQSADDDRVSARTSVSNNTWQHAEDPQPIATGTGGSPWPQLGDLLVDATGVPVGLISVGVGGTRVDQWLPGTDYYDNRLKAAIESLGNDGFKAILWHQGESDSLAGTGAADYAARLQQIIAQSRTDAGFDVPWGVALASYHPSATAENEAKVIAGQKSVITGDPLVFRGAFTDDFHTLGYLSDSVHFNQQGLDEHAARWAAAIVPVPEPATLLIWSLLAGLGVGLGWRRRK